MITANVNTDYDIMSIEIDGYIDEEVYKPVRIYLVHNVAPWIIDEIRKEARFVDFAKLFFSLSVEFDRDKTKISEDEIDLFYHDPKCPFPDSFNRKIAYSPDVLDKINKDFAEWKKSVPTNKEILFSIAKPNFEYAINRVLEQKENDLYNYFKDGIGADVGYFSKEERDLIFLIGETWESSAYDALGSIEKQIDIFFDAHPFDEIKMSYDIPDDVYVVKQKDIEELKSTDEDHDYEPLLEGNRWVVVVKKNDKN